MGHLLRVEGSEQRLKRNWLEWLRVSLFQGTLVCYVLHELVFFTVCIVSSILKRAELVKLAKIEWKMFEMAIRIRM